MDNITYKATLTITSPAGPGTPMHIAYTWDPPLSEVVKQFGADALPPSYQMMGLVLDTAVFPAVVYNERYEAMLAEDGDEEVQ